MRNTTVTTLVVGLLLCSSTTILGFGSDLSVPRRSPSKLAQQQRKHSTKSTRTSLFATTNEWGIPHPDDLPALTRDGSVHKVLPNGGRISLIGSGPGDPELLTLKAARMLQDPDALVVSDRLVSTEILQMIRGELKVARKLPGCAELAQDEIYHWCHQGLAAGKHVIRLKIGDPFVFGRGGEEVLQFRTYGVESEVVPVRCRYTPCR